MRGWRASRGACRAQRTPTAKWPRTTFSPLLSTPYLTDAHCKVATHCSLLSSLYPLLKQLKFLGEGIHIISDGLAVLASQSDECLLEVIEALENLVLVFVDIMPFRCNDLGFEVEDWDLQDIRRGVSQDALESSVCVSHFPQDFLQSRLCLSEPFGDVFWRY